MSGIVRRLHEAARPASAARAPLGPCPMTYVLDTDSVVSMVRGLKVRDNPNRRQRDEYKTARRIFERARKKNLSGHQIALSAITAAELEFGARKSGDYEKEIEATRRALTPFSLLDFDTDACAAHFGRIRHALET